MLAKNFALAFGIAIVFPTMIHFGVSTFSLEPRWRDYMATPLIDQNSAEYHKKEAEFNAAEKKFEKHLFAVAVPLGLLALIAGAFLPKQATGTGLMFGGIFSICDGFYNYWSELPDSLKFGSLVVTFVILLFLGHLKLERKEI